MSLRVAQSGASKVVTFYKNGDKFFRGHRMSITPRRYRNMNTLLNDLTRLLNLPLGARYVLTKTGKAVEDLNEFEHGQGYICSSFPKLKHLKYGVGDHLPYWNSAKQQPSKASVTHAKQFRSITSSNDQFSHRNRTDTIKPKVVTVIRYGHKPRKSVKVLLNRRTAQTLDQVLNEVTRAIGVWGANAVRRLYNLSGERINEVSDLFKQDDYFIAVGNERVQLSDMNDISHEISGRHISLQKVRLPSINSVDEGDNHLINNQKATRKIKLRNSVKLPCIDRKVEDCSGSDCVRANMGLSAYKRSKRNAQKENQSSNAHVKDSASKTSDISRELNEDDKHKPKPVQQGKVDDKEGGVKQHNNVDKDVDETEREMVADSKNMLNSSRFEKNENSSKPKNVEDVYAIGEKIGDGNFAIVRIGVEKLTKAKYALKIIDRKKIQGKEKMLKDEIRIMRSCNHVNIVRLYDIYESLFDVYLVMELVSGGDLFDEISNYVKFEEIMASSFAQDILRALQYLHNQKIVHRDLKPENLLVYINANGKKQLKLADFGLAVEVVVPLFTVCGTPTYVAPEILEETGYGMKVDVWAAGVILYIMLCGFPPFRSPNKDQDELFDLILAGDYEFLSPYWDEVSQQAKDLVAKLLVVNPKRRFSAEQVLNHPWIQENGNNVKKNIDMTLQKPVFNARRKFKGAAIAVKGSRRLQNIAQEFQFKRGEKLLV